MKKRITYKNKIKKAAIIFCMLFFSGILYSQTADFSFEYDTICINEPVNIINTSIGAYNYDWNFEDVGINFLPESEQIISHIDTGGYWYWYELDDIVRQGNEYYGFSFVHIDSSHVDGHRSSTLNSLAFLIRYNFGNGLDNTPTKDSLLRLPDTSYFDRDVDNISIQKDIDGNYYGLFFSDGSYSHKINLFRLSFGNDITNIPQIEYVRAVNSDLWIHHWFNNGESSNLFRNNNKWYYTFFEPSYDTGDSTFLNILEFTDGLNGDSSSINHIQIKESQLEVNFENSSSFDNYNIELIKEKDIWYGLLMSNDTLLHLVKFSNDFRDTEVIDNLDYDSYQYNPWHFDCNIFHSCNEKYGIFESDSSYNRKFEIIHFDDSITGAFTREETSWDTLGFRYFSRPTRIYKYRNRNVVFDNFDYFIGFTNRIFLNPESVNLVGNPDHAVAEPEFTYCNPGTYTVSLTINDDIAKIICKQITVIAPPDIDSIAYKWVSECDTTNGNIEIFPPFEIDRFKYSIDSGVSFHESNFFDSLSMGNYFLAIDFGSAQCVSFLDTAVLISCIFAPIIDSVNYSDITDCNITDGIIEISASGGDGTYQYTINNGIDWNAIGNFINLPGGLYHPAVRKEDSTCQIDYPYPIQFIEPDQPVFNQAPQVTNASDCGFNDALISLDVTGEYATLIFSLDTISWQLDTVFVSLDTGIYEIFIKYLESNNCLTKYPDSIIITQPPAPQVDSVIYQDQKSCFTPDAYIYINGSGGINDYQYTINNGNNWSDSDNFMQLESGDFFVGIRNADGTCEKIDFLPLILLEACIDNVYDTICRDSNIYTLSGLLPVMKVSTGTWIDVDSTGSLSGDLIRTEIIPEGSFLFVFKAGDSEISANIVASSLKTTGNTIYKEFCDDQVNLFDVLEPGTYDSGGIWREIDENIEIDSLISGQNGTLFYKYYFPYDSSSGCAGVQTLAKLYIDSIPPEIICSEVQKVYLNISAGEKYFVITDSLHPEVLENCENYFIINSYNQISSLVGTSLEEGVYEVIWTVEDLAENYNECLSEIVVRKFNVPNLITPNGDGANDIWIVDLRKNYPQAEIYVYDRWGNLVFASKDGFSEWDGTVNGKLVPVDAYQYIIRHNKNTLFDGSITIWY